MSKKIKGVYGSEIRAPFYLTSSLSKHLESNTLDKAYEELHGLGNEYYPITKYNLSNIQIYDGR